MVLGAPKQRSRLKALSNLIKSQPATTVRQPSNTSAPRLRGHMSVKTSVVPVRLDHANGSTLADFWQ
jgi:hypothetical protein